MKGQRKSTADLSPEGGEAQDGHYQEEAQAYLDTGVCRWGTWSYRGQTLEEESPEKVAG